MCFVSQHTLLSPVFAFPLSSPPFASRLQIFAPFDPELPPSYCTVYTHLVKSGGTTVKDQLQRESVKQGMPKPGRLQLERLRLRSLSSDVMLVTSSDRSGRSEPVVFAGTPVAELVDCHHRCTAVGGVGSLVCGAFLSRAFVLAYCSLLNVYATVRKAVRVV